MCMKTPKVPNPAPAPMVVPVERAAAPTISEAAGNATTRRRKGAGSLRIDLAAPQGGSGLNIG